MKQGPKIDKGNKKIEAYVPWFLLLMNLPKKPSPSGVMKIMFCWLKAIWCMEKGLRWVHTHCLQELSFLPQLSTFRKLLLIIILLLIWQSPGLPGWRKVNLITVTRKPLHPSIAAGFYCLTTSPGFLPALCEKWSGFFYVHRVWLSYTRDWRLKVSSERNELTCK